MDIEGEPEGGELWFSAGGVRDGIFLAGDEAHPKQCQQQA